MTIAQEEIFGPVLAVIAYDDDDDAVRIANDSDYGLSGRGILRLRRAGDVHRPPRPHRVDLRERGNWYGADGPYGGYKRSGIGRQNGVEGFETYLETKLVGVVG